MKLIEQQLVARLTADTTLANYVGTRIRPVEPDENSDLPHLTYTLTGCSRSMPTLDGDDTAITATYQIDVWSETSKECNDVGEAVKACLDNFSGGNITQTRWEGQELTSEESDAENRPNYHLTQEYTVHGDEALIVATSSGVPKVEVREDGLYFDNTKIGTAADVDLSGYAQLGIPNEFTELNTFSARVVVGGGDGTQTNPDLGFANLNTTNPVVKWTPTSAQTGLIFYSGNNQICRLQDNGACVFSSFSTIGGMNVGDWFICRGTPNQSAQITFGSVETPSIHCQNLGNQASTATLQADAGHVNSCAFIAKATSGQTADTVKVLDSTGATDFAIAPGGKIKTNQTTAATTPGNVVGKMPVYGTGGTLVGYMPIYDNIT